MHELTVALRIRESLEAELAAETDVSVTSVELRVGALSGIVPAALEFAWSHAVADSRLLAGSRVAIDWVDVSGFCDRCGDTKTITSLQSLRCPTCSEAITRITGGDELEIRTVDVRDPISDSV